MTLKRFLFVTYINIIKKIYLRTGIYKAKFYNNKIVYFTVAFNNDFIVKEQIRLLKKYITDKDYIHIIIDNSSIYKKRKFIKSVCEEEDVEYISLPFNWFSKIDIRPSYSHGLAMSWVYRNIIKKIQPQYFGFIDHDIFPVHNFSLMEKIDGRDFYGCVQWVGPEMEKGPFWYLWAGFCFFDYQKLKGVSFNFMPNTMNGVYFDTGGSNFLSLYCKYSRKSIENLPRRAHRDNMRPIREGNSYYSDFVDLICEEWVHSINGSNWAKQPEKNDILKELLKQY